MFIANENEGTVNNVVSTCYVISWQDHGMFSVETTIYLSYPNHVGPYEELHQFENVFDAKKYITSHVLPGTFIQIAA